VQLAAPADLFVTDAFGCAHRAHASTAGIARFLTPAVAGLLLQKVRARDFAGVCCVWGGQAAQQAGLLPNNADPRLRYAARS